MNLYEETKILLNQYDLKAKKSYGQNFLINEQIIQDIIQKSNLTENDVVLEIGPGLGTLTKELMKVVKLVIAVELDQDMVEILQDRFGETDKLQIINADILKLNINEITERYGKIKVVANLPYYITTPIIMKLLESKYNISSITVMVQKEVGLRLASKEGSSDYSAITVSLNYYSNAKVIIDVPKENFLPSPKVDSVVIKIDILDTPKVMVEDEKLFFNLIKAGFSQRRKTINNSLSSGGIPKDVILKTLSELNIDAKKRAEDLSIQDFANISNKIQLFLKGNKND